MLVMMPAHLRKPESESKGLRARRARRRTRRLARSNIVARHPVRSAAIVVVVGLTPAWASLGNALGNPSLGASVSARLAEWVRDHGGASIVVWAENLWYSHHAPPVGGKPAASAIPKLLHPKAPKTRPSGAGAVAHLAPPVALKPFVTTPLQGEGVWQPVGRHVHGLPAVYETFMRPDAIHTSIVDGIAWMDTKLLRATLYSGSYIPGGGPYSHTAPITSSDANSLVAAFNAGFRMQDANGGYYTQGKVILPLRVGGASFVIYKNGSATVGQWGRDVSMTPAVASVRQNLALLVDHGAPVPGLDANDTSKWGFTLGNQVYVWRSGVGVTADGALVYVGGPALNITGLANLLVRAGAVRAMELDINTDWVNFSAFTPTTANGPATSGNGSDLLPNMSASPLRYFESWWARDFFTMSAR